MWWFCAENRFGAERWCECSSSGAPPVAAGDCRPDEGEREKDEGGVDAGEQVREGGPDERPNEPASLPACATALAAAPVAGGAPPGSEGFTFLRRGGSGGTALGEGVPATEFGGAGVGSGDWAFACRGAGSLGPHATSKDL